MTGMRTYLASLRPPIHHPPAFSLLRNYRRRPTTNENLIHAANAALFWRLWRGLGAWGFAKLYLMWITRFPIELAVALKRYGPAAKRVFGRGYAAQAWDMTRLAAVNWLPRKDYYAFALAGQKFGPPARGTVAHHVFEHASIYIGLAKTGDGAIHINNKADFIRFCRDHGFPHPATHALVTEDRVTGLDGDALETALPRRALFCKPVRNFSGRGTSLWQPAGRGRFRNHRGDEMSEEEMLAALRAQSLNEPGGILIQDGLTNHPDLEALVGPGLATYRVVTAINESGEPEVTRSDLKSLGDAESIANNLAAGGVLYRVDPVMRVFRFGHTKDILWTSRYLDVHPVTGKKVIDTPPPGIGDVFALGVEMHRALPEFFAIGWDIAFTPKGASVLEANYNAGMDQNDFYGSRMGELTAWHAQRALDATEPADSRWRVGADLRTPV